MSWILVICLLGAGGIFPKTQSMDAILEINEKLIPYDDPASSFLSEGDIVLSVTSKFSPKLSLWPWVNETIVIPYDLSASYDEQQQKVIFDAFKDLEASTCIRFVERTNQRNYIFILPGNGCYSAVGRVGKRQVVSLAFQCIERGKGVVLHELMHVIGFWHEHSRADRDEYVTIHWNAIRKEYWSNFCKYETTNMVVKYDLESLLHYSNVAFAKSGNISIEPRVSRTNMGQRIKLSDSDILRVNKLYRCPPYVPSEDDDEDLMVLDSTSQGVVATCPEANVNDPENLSTAVFTESPMAASSFSKELGSGSSPTEESKSSLVPLYTSSPAFKTGSAPTSLSSQESKFASTGFIYPSTQEPTHSIQGLSALKADTTLVSTRAPESIQNNSIVLIPHRITDQLSIQSTRRTAAPESIHEDNSTVLILQGTTEQSFTVTAPPESVQETSTVLFLQGVNKHSKESTEQTAALESIQDNSTVLIPHVTTEQPSRGSSAPAFIQEENSEREDNSVVLIPQGATTQSPMESTKGTAAPKDVQENSTVLIPHIATEQSSTVTAAPESVQDNSTTVIPEGTAEHPIESTRGTEAPESVHEDNSTVLIPQGANKHSKKSTEQTAALESIQDNSTVLIPHDAIQQPSRGPSAPASIQEDNATVLIRHRTTEQLPTESTIGTAALGSVHEDNSTVLIPQETTEQSSRETVAPQTSHGNSTVFIPQAAITQHPVESTRGTSAPETEHKNNATVLIPHRATEQHPIESRKGTAVPESVQQDYSTVLILHRTIEQTSRTTADSEIVREYNSTVLMLQEGPTQTPPTRGTAAPESAQDNSIVLIPQRVTEQPPVESTRGTMAPESLQDNVTGLILHRAIERLPRGTAAPESLQENNSTVANTQNATNLLSDHRKAFATVISVVGSSVTKSKSTMGSGDHWGTPVEMNTILFKSNFMGEINSPEDSTIQANFEIKSSDSTTVSAINKGSLTKAILPISTIMPKRTMSNTDIMEENSALQTSASSQSGKIQRPTAKDIESSPGSGEGLNVSQDQDDEHAKKKLNTVRKRSLAGQRLGSWLGQLLRWLDGNTLTNLYNNRRKRSTEIIEPFCGFERGFCGWTQSNEDDLDWRLGWGSLNDDVGHFRPKGFHLSLKSSPGVSVAAQRALLLRPIVQPSNCVSFWYSSRNSIMGSLNVYITSSGGKRTLLWTSGGHDHVRWTKAQIMLPPNLLYNNVYVVVEAKIGPSDRSNIAIDDLYVGQCS